MERGRSITKLDLGDRKGSTQDYRGREGYLVASLHGNATSIIIILCITLHPNIARFTLVISHEFFTNQYCFLPSIHRQDTALCSDGAIVVSTFKLTHNQLNTPQG